MVTMTTTDLAAMKLPGLQVRQGLDPNRWVAEMTEVQRRVYFDARATHQDVEDVQATIFDRNTAAVEATLQQYAGRYGCNGAQVRLSPDVRRGLAQAAIESARTIVNTFNYELARQIVAIGADTPRANYRTYRSRLFGDTPNSIYAGSRNWASGREVERAVVISRTETTRSIDFANGRFFDQNRELVGRAEVRPRQASCEVCQAAVAGNPYESIDDARDASQVGGWPAHVRCIHYVEPIEVRQVDDCAELWLGGG